jgi:hypothetical protein
VAVGDDNDYNDQDRPDNDVDAPPHPDDHNDLHNGDNHWNCHGGNEYSAFRVRTILTRSL